MEKCKKISNSMLENLGKLKLKQGRSHGGVGVYCTPKIWLVGKFAVDF